MKNKGRGGGLWMDRKEMHRTPPPEDRHTLQEHDDRHGQSVDSGKCSKSRQHKLNLPADTESDEEKKRLREREKKNRESDGRQN